MQVRDAYRDRIQITLHRTEYGVPTPMILMALRTEPNLSEAMPKCRPTKTNTGRNTFYGRHGKEDYDPIKVTLINVLSMADRCRHSRFTEAHCVSVVVNPLLSLVRRLKRYQKEGSKIAVVDL